MSDIDTTKENHMPGSLAAAARSGKSVKYLIVTALVVAAFLGAYRYALAKTGVDSPASQALPAAAGDGQPVSAGGGAAGGGSACACCGTGQPTEGGVTGTKVEGRASVADGAQKMSVDLSKGYYEPNQLVLKAGVPAEITFGQSAGCTAQVVSQELGFAEDLSSGPRTVKLPALEKGEYPFYCGMQMVFGKIVVE